MNSPLPSLYLLKIFFGYYLLKIYLESQLCCFLYEDDYSSLLAVYNRTTKICFNKGQSYLCR